MTVTTALYRRYRPDSFADVIGQEHVTEPLMTALRKNRVNHAYLFSGPRGCGKTTSARILARCLNCAQGPTDTPCGTCPSCVELARGGSGSLDVIEIDAASHGGVDDARDLRERATYAPVRDRYKIFIIDEAHMVTSAGFNALLKIVEEPPEHIKFIFATTEPDKVIGTIRSRTHHYPFRLVPPEPLMAYLEMLCNQENVPVAPGVLSLVIRAGGGSVRDSLSVLDQLMAGAGPNGLDYELAVALLGYTHASLLDDVVEAVAASDAATVFRAVDRVIQTGHDPRRFVEDLLERFRDLIIVKAMPESAQTILRGMPADQIARLQNQAHNLGAAELSRAADVTNTALTEMTGATSPRLHLELLCARILLPSSEHNERGMAARIDRVERRLNYAGNDVGAPAPSASTTDAPGTTGAAGAMDGGGPSVSRASAPAPDQSAPAAAPALAARPEQAHAAAAPLSPAAQPAMPQQSAPGARAPEPVSPQVSAAPPARPEPAPAPAPEEAQPAALAAEGNQPASRDGRVPLTAPRVSTGDWPREEAGNARSSTSSSPVPPAPQTPVAARAAPAPAASQAPVAGQAPVAQAPGISQRPAQQPAPAASPAPPSGMGDVEVLRRAWPDVLQTLAKIKRSTWALVEPNAQVGAFDGQVLTLSFTTQGLAGAFGRADHSENLRQAIHKTVGIDCQITAVAGGATQASSEPNPKAPTSQEAPATSADVAWGLAPAPTGPDPSAQSGSGTAPSARAESVPVQSASVQPVAAQFGPTQPVSNQRGASTAADVAWGLAPASTPADVPAPSPMDAPAPADALPAGAPAPATSPGAGQAPGGRSGRSGDARHGSSAITSPVAGQRGGATGQGDGDAGGPGNNPAAAAAAPARPAAHTTASGPVAPAASAPEPYPAPEGDYSYSDDDWGPPRDEDAPPLDEEPPMDWNPPAGGKARSVSGEPAAGTRPEGQQAATNNTSVAASVQQASAAVQGAVVQGALPKSGGHDPWTRAVEQAPGVWVVGEVSNVGRNAASTPEAETAGPTAVPRYEPAAAQVPPSIPVTGSTGNGPAAAPETHWSLADAASAVDRREPEYAMASAATGAGPQAAASHAAGSHAGAPRSPVPAQALTASPAAAPAATPATPGARPTPAPASSPAPAKGPSPAGAPAQASGEGRQSLYQRLSNSPEAEAGRAKAPARAVAAAASYVQDIPSADDETIEESGVFGRAAVERILGGKLIEERSLDGSPVVPRY